MSTNDAEMSKKSNRFYKCIPHSDRPDKNGRIVRVSHRDLSNEMFEVEVFTLEKTENDDSVRPIGNKVSVRIRWRHSTAVVPSDDGTVTCNEAEVHMWDDVAKWRLLPAGQWREMLRDSSGLPGDPVSKSVADDTTGASTTSLKVSDAESTSETKPSLESNANDHQHTPDNDRPTPSSDDQIPHEDHPASDNTELAHDKTQPAPTNT